MPKRVPVTKTSNPLHFEDLEPHRFEDLVRRLLYGFRDWADIEPTGRGGSDDGFDARAWEKGDKVENVSEDGEEGIKPVEGRLWQVQCKREKSIAPAKVRKIVADGVDGSNPPHGYILAAATNLSKAALDAFRDELRRKGVREFQFWGKDHLEDQLAQPQNDDVLFTFFGLSRGVKRRARASEVKFAINNKNKLQRLIFGSEEPTRHREIRQTFLLRDIKDEHYPSQEEYDDFESSRRWEEHEATQVDPQGVWFRARERYAYVDTEKKVFGATSAVDSLHREHLLDAANRAKDEDLGKRVERHWRHLPLKNQAKLGVAGFVAFDDMLVIDEKGDTEYPHPHVYVDFGKDGPFSRVCYVLRRGREYIDMDGYARVDGIFPESFADLLAGRVHEAASLGLPEQILGRLGHSRGAQTIYAFDKQLAGVKENDLIHFEKVDSGMDKDLEVTNVSKSTVNRLVAQQGEGSGTHFRNVLAEHAGRPVTDDDVIRVVECITVILPYQSQHYAYMDYEY